MMKPERELHNLDAMTKDELVAELIDVKHQNEELSKRVNIDGLTGLFNHRYLQSYLKREVSKAQRHRHTVSLVMCDIDYFKAFNDSFGHQVGDSVLRHFSQLLKNNIRDHDILARYGGEEFAIVLSATTLQDALVVAEKLRQLVCKTAFVEEGQTFNMTASFGVACCDPNVSLNLSVKELIYNADLAMITAKNNGRNCTEFFLGKKEHPASLDKSVSFPKYASERVAKEEHPTVFVVDDDDYIIQILVSLLSEDYNIRTGHSGKALFKLLEKELPDVILLDIVMPEMGGYEICRLLKQNPRYADIPVFFLSAKNAMEDEIKGFSVGIFDYITKPICPPTFRMRLKNCLKIQQQKKQLDELIEQQSTYLYDWQSSAIECISAVSDYRNLESKSHLERCGLLMRMLATTASENPKYVSILTDEVIDLLSRAAPFHDIGKLGIPDRILLKPGRLTEEEFDIMKQHATMGFGVVTIAASEEKTSPFLRYVAEIAYSHHEKWDGSGYPQGLRGTEIPISARLMAIIDVYDAITSERCYKKAISHEKAIEIIVSDSGKHFDPDLIEVMLSVQDKMKKPAED